MLETKTPILKVCQFQEKVFDEEEMGIQAQDLAKML